MKIAVIAATQFFGVPQDLLPEALSEREARAILTASGQDQGTDGERLVECAGRTCYDSYGKGRTSSQYHQHIMEVDHGSVTEHAWISFFLTGVSRGLTHELVRHRVGVAISQRSTRYVDESKSRWALHPLLTAFALSDEPGRLSVSTACDAVQKMSRDAYDEIAGKLQDWLVRRGIDKGTARKQARGAARGLLGNALSTEMVWSCNIRALKTVLAQRAKAAADAEIRLFANRIYELARPVWPAYLGCYQKRECPDGIGYELYVPDRRDDEIRVLKERLAMLEEASRSNRVHAENLGARGNGG
jgi:thymidylate synthase (FAD)